MFRWLIVIALILLLGMCYLTNGRVDLLVKLAESELKIDVAQNEIIKNNVRNINDLSQNTIDLIDTLRNFKCTYGL